MASVRAYIGVGSNLGNRAATIDRALRLLSRAPGVRVRRRSTIRHTVAVGAPGPDYLNCVAEVDCTIAPRALLHVLQRIETALGRTRPYRWAPRTIDLDLLLFGHAEIAEPGLEVPHPRLHERLFALEPLAELDPDLILPGRGPLADLVAGLQSS